MAAFKRLQLITRQHVALFGHKWLIYVESEPWVGCWYRILLTWVHLLVQVEELCRTALNRRYRLLPHFYTLFYQAHKNGVPVMTPLFFAGMVSDSIEGSLFPPKNNYFLLKICHVSFRHWLRSTYLNPIWKLHSGSSKDEINRVYAPCHMYLNSFHSHWIKGKMANVYFFPWQIQVIHRYGKEMTHSW